MKQRTSAVSNNYLNAQTVKSNIPFAPRIKLALSHFIFWMENVTLKWSCKILYKKSMSPKKILIFRTGSLGDSICAIPSIRAVRQNFPSAQIDILTNAGHQNLVGLRYLLDKSLYTEIIDYDGLPKLILFRLLRRKKYDMVIQLPQVDAPFLSLLRDLTIFRRIAPSGFGWFISQNKWFRKTQAKYLLFSNENQRLLNYLRDRNLTINDESIALALSEEDIRESRHLMETENKGSSRKKIAVVVGAKRPQNRWPIQNFKIVCDYFSPICNIFLIGSTEDSKLVEPLLDIPNVVNFCGRLKPLQSAAMLSFCDVTLSNDTGPMHMSYAVQTPVVALFSSRDLPGKWYPPGKGNYVFRNENVFCQACFNEACSNNVCMQEILPCSIITALKQILA